MASDTFGVVGSTIKLRSGQYFDLLAPWPGDIVLADIAGALSKACRFGGHVREFYSVAEHSVLASVVAAADGLDVEAQRAALLHDASEAFIGDIVKPLKLLFGDVVRGLEQRIEAAIAQRFAVDFETWRDDVKRIDRELLIAEKRALFAPDGVRWAGEGQVRELQGLAFRCLDWREAEGLFLVRASALGVE